MKEINEAYDTVMRERQSRADSSSGYGYSAGAGTGKFDYIRTLINNRSFYEAEIQLDAVAKDERNAEWYYLKGCVFMGRGWYFEASKHFHRACEMDPQNPEYAAALNSMKICHMTTTGRTDSAAARAVPAIYARGLSAPIAAVRLWAAT